MYRTDPEFKNRHERLLKGWITAKLQLRTYFTMQDRIQTAAEKRAKDLELKSQATLQADWMALEPSSDYYSEEELDRMSVKELKANWAKGQSLHGKSLEKRKDDNLWHIKISSPTIWAAELKQNSNELPSMHLTATAIMKAMSSKWVIPFAFSELGNQPLRLRQTRLSQ